MIQLIINLLTPIFEKLGVSPVDVETYVNSMSGYIYVILITLVLMAAVMIAAHWAVKKGTRHIVRWGAGISWVLIVTVIANIICYGPLYNNISIILNSTARVTEESAAKSKEVIEDVGDEGMVLVKNENNLLPLAENSNINVFGWASTNPIFGGTGSGSSDSANALGVLESLENAGFQTNKDLTKIYTDYRDTRNTPGVGVAGTDWTLPEPTLDVYTDEVMDQAKEFSDTALIVLSRSGGEGADVPSDMNKVINGTWDIRDEVAGGNENYNYFAASYENNSENNSDKYDDFDPGESYLELSNTEEAMIEKVCSEFDKVAVVINANNTMELGWVDQYESIQSVILAPGTGAYGMSGLGRILDGEVNPSGRTVDTYVYDLTKTPAANNQGDFSFNNVDDLKEAFLEADPGYQGNIAFVNYVEGIYVGYKFYETAAEEGVISYDDLVQYPFGHGLSYTTFTQEMKNFTDQGDSVSFEIAKENLASYDTYGVKAETGGYVLEAGEYGISIRTDSHNVIAEETFVVEEDIDYSQEGRSSDQATANNQFEEYSEGTVEYLSRADHFANYEKAAAAPTDDKYVMDEETREYVTEKSTAYYDPTKYDDPNEEMPVTGADNGMKLADMTGKDFEDPDWDPLLDQLTVDEMVELVNLGGFQTVAVKSVDKVMTMDSDGTSGVNDWVTGVYGTAFPTEVLIAQTWSKEIAEAVGDAMGAEYADCEIYGWYGPAMNIHRNSFNGRNFEYYSEDGVLSGKIASATINAAGEHGVYAYIKHFVLNDQETNRCTLLLTYATEQSIREIFLKPFEECVKNYDFRSKPLAVMSSFNFIGDVYCGSNPHLLNNVLRGEWGFRGMVLTDWDGSYGYQSTDDCIRNGNDIMLGFNSYESNKITDTDAASCVTALRSASKNIMYTVANSGAYTTEKEKELFTPMTKLFIGIDAAIVLISAAIMAYIIIRQRKKRKLAEEEAAA